MRILGIDTSSKVLSIALSEDETLIIEESDLLDRRHSSLLVPKINDILEKSNFSINDIDAFIIGLGPGSFTGLRIGVSTVKGFGIATKKPCIGIPSIDALPLNVEGGYATIVPIIDAKRQQLYCAVYKKEEDRITRRSRYLLLSVVELIKMVKGPTFFLGDGVSLYREKIELLNKRAVFLEEEFWYPRAGNLIKLALKKIKKYKKCDLEKLTPIYMYPKDCQVKKR